MPLKACAYSKVMMLLPRGIERYSVRPWRVWTEYKSSSSTTERLTWNLPSRKTYKGWSVPVTAP